MWSIQKQCPNWSLKRWIACERERPTAKSRARRLISCHRHLSWLFLVGVMMVPLVRGLLCGWSKAGARPEFKLVTGISTGA